MKEELKKYINKNFEIEKKSKNLFGNFSLSKMISSPCYSDDEEMSINEEEISYKKSANSVEQYLKENDKYNDFQTMLFKMIDERNLKDSEVYNKVHIDRRLFSKIRSDKNYHLSKETIIL